MRKIDGYFLWLGNPLLGDGESPQLKKVTENLCHKLGKCGSIMNSKQYYVDTTVLDGHYEILFTGVPTEMVVVRIPNLYVKAGMKVDGKDQRIVEGYFTVSVKSN